MIEFDRKLTPFSARLLSKQRSFSKRQWDIFLISFFLYFIIIYIPKFFFESREDCRHFYFNIYSICTTVYIGLRYYEFFVLFSSQPHARLWTLNDLWKCLPVELAVDCDQWTHIEIVFFMEKTRLLHSKLCELLKKFTIGFGPLLLAFFSFSFSCLLIGIFCIITRFHILVSGEHSAAEVWDQIFNVTAHIQIVIFMLSIIVYVSFIEEQIKMFMNQMSLSGLDQISAFGFFDVNLNLVTSILVLIITGITTLVQMKHNSIIMELYNDTFSYLDSLNKNET